MVIATTRPRRLGDDQIAGRPMGVADADVGIDLDGQRSMATFAG